MAHSHSILTVSEYDPWPRLKAMKIDKQVCVFSSDLNREWYALGKDRHNYVLGATERQHPTLPNQHTA